MENERRGKRRGEKDAKRKGKERRNGKIKEEERRRRSADDDNGSGQGAVEREKKGKEEDSVVRVWERDKGWKGGGGERRGYLTVPPREAVEVLIRNAGDHLHGTRSSTPSPPSPLPPSFAFLPPLVPLHQLAVLSLRVSLFPRFVSLLPSFVSVLAYLLPFLLRFFF